MTDQEKSGSNRPYPPASNIISLLQRVRSRNLPDRIDNDYLLDAGIAQSLIHRVGFAIRFLGLVDGETPSALLKSIASSTDEEYRELLSMALRTSYRDIFDVVDPSLDDVDRIVNVFRRYTPASQRGRMVTFFLGMCREAGIETLDSKKSTSPSSANGPLHKGRPMGSPTTSLKSKAPIPSPKQVQSAVTLEESLPNPTLLLLVRSLPAEGTPMSDAKRAQWLRMAEATLAFAFPREEDAQIARSGDEE